MLTHSYCKEMLTHSYCKEMLTHSYCKEMLTLRVKTWICVFDGITINIGYIIIHWFYMSQ